MKLRVLVGSSLRKTLRSFTYAFKGIFLVVRYENNTRIHLLATVAVIGVGFFVHLSVVEWAIILTQIGLVWMAETMNTALEKLVDLISPEFNPKAGAIKDIAAGAVLITSTVAAIVGLLVFGERIWAMAGK